MTSAFQMRSQGLLCDGVALTDVAAAYGTPAYVYSADFIIGRYTALACAFAGMEATLCYAVKANSNQAILALLAKAGAGADVVSIGEYRRARRAGISPNQIVFAGVGKTQPEMAEALAGGLLQFNLESLAELAALNAVAEQLGRTAPVALRLNPDVDAKTHGKITTGKAENKFGLPLEAAAGLRARLTDFPHIVLEGLAVHIGSQITDLAPFRTAYGILAETARAFQAAGYALRRLDLGGGLGVHYDAEVEPDLGAYAQIVRETVGPLGLPLVLEPGRTLVAGGGGLLTKILYIKEGRGKRFLIVDAAMNDLLRPTLYEAHHGVLIPGDRMHELTTDVVGPVCETGDVLAIGRRLPAVEAGTLMVIEGAGAYAAVMGSSYNSRALPPEVLVRGGRFDLIRARQDLNALIDQDLVPADL